VPKFFETEVEDDHELLNKPNTMPIRNFLITPQRPFAGSASPKKLFEQRTCKPSFNLSNSEVNFEIEDNFVSEKSDDDSMEADAANMNTDEDEYHTTNII
jgi:hypothetical protein